ncbi:hypothetical protein A5482_014935 (plasmid) [Cyanobacterium sp. IPPAS B-1200]|uniref:hypothetical protein n=1 Tax=Cyanobacterium sp. IPPAS B-1200 TaxID=1562720 RepID=UPI0008524D1B|nr:hypothetical protein [Cyanobacterium sp. IPPAS B-1200]OEJ78371.1 hypothetical protein A5482_13480 [Cyanobacterium sp. IPPAS B-1200]
MIDNLYPTIKKLSRTEKIQLLQVLATEIANDEGINTAEEEEKEFWLTSSQISLQQIWGHPDEEIYNELL